jgi:hypothetical protein
MTNMTTDDAWLDQAWVRTELIEAEAPVKPEGPITEEPKVDWF